ncbi:MAG: alanine racemase [Thermodesulfobacteriota bacterium]|nr:alanine racemase [Thermodesulfobacteriota bacterium]
MRPTRVIIDLCAIRENMEAIKQYTKTRIMMAIKADAYGHGAHETGRYVQDEGLAQSFGVTSIEEGVDLRENGIDLPVLIFSLINPAKEDVDHVFRYDLTPSVADVPLVHALKKGAERWQRPINVHVKTDTGMGRLGQGPDDTLGFLETLVKTEGIRISGLYTHFPVSDTPDNAFTSSQIKVFRELIQRARNQGIDPGICHCANSGAVLDHPASYMDMVRPGIMCYGLYPSGQATRYPAIRPAMTMRSEIMFVKRVKKGRSLSYGLTYTVSKDTYIATIPVGYADGYPWALHGKAKVLIEGRKYSIAGRICMDMCMIDLGDDLYAPGQEVILFGEKTITAEDVAAWAGTIPYEITCNMSRRVPRTYV